MTKEELKNELMYFQTQAVGIIMYFILKGNEQDELIIKKADIDSEEALPELKKQFLKSVEEQVISKKGLDIMNISSADERKNVIYEYDIDEFPQQLNVINEILKNQDQTCFNFKSDELGDLKGYIILIGDTKKKLALYKHHYPISLMKRDNFFLKQSKERFVKFEDDLIRIDDSFQFFSVNGTLFIKDIDKLEKFYGFQDVIKKKANESIDLISKEGLLEDIQVLKDDVENMTFARKLTKIMGESLVLGNVPKTTIIEFTKTNTVLKGKFKYSADGEKIILDTKKSKELFLKLLNDDFLRSELTDAYYASLAKDKLSSKIAN